MRRSWRARLPYAALLLGAVTLTGVAPVGAVTPAQRLAVVARSFHFTAAGALLAPGPTTVQFVNASSRDEHELIALNLAPGCSGLTAAQAIALLDQGGTAFRDCLAGPPEGFASASPGQRDTRTFRMAPGRTLFYCAVTSEDGIPHYRKGLIGFLDVPSVVNIP